MAGCDQKRRPVRHSHGNLAEAPPNITKGQVICYIADGPADRFFFKTELTQELLAWLDKYFGPAK